MNELILYMIRWQLSTPVLALVPYYLKKKGVENFWITAAIANLIGSLMFYSIDKWIFR